MDLRADIFSVGVLLFEMVTGQSPFRRDNLMDSFTPSPLTRRLMNSVRAQIPEELQRIVSRCLTENAGRPLSGRTALAEELRLLRRHTEGRLDDSVAAAKPGSVGAIPPLPPARYSLVRGRTD